MKNSRKTAGATLVLTVLVVMLLLAAVVVVTGQLAISARRTSADQDATVQAQYVAESGVARAQARLSLVDNLMGSKLSPPADTTTTQMLTQILQLCGTVSPSASELAAVPTGSLATPYAVCTATSGNDLLSGDSNLANSTKLNFLLNNLNDADYSTSGFDLSKLSSNPTTAERLFWAQSLTPPGPSGGVTISDTLGSSSTNALTSKMGIALTQVQRFGSDSYRLTFTIPDVVSSSTTIGGGRTLSVKGVGNTYSYEISRGGFAKYALFTNHHFADAASESGCAANANACNRVTFTSNTLFSGPVHSNQNFLIQGTPYFAGQVSSAGCRPGQIRPTTINGVATETCGAAATPGAYFQSTALTAPSSMLPNSNAPVACNIATTPCPAANIIANPQFQGGVNWGAGFQPLPKNSNDQASAAVNGGLAIGGNVTSMNLAAGSIVPLGGVSADAQLITYTPQGGTTVQLAATSDKSMYIRTTVLGVAVWKKAVQVNGTWIDASTPAAIAATLTGTALNSFNGVIYASGTITSLTGPPRTTASDPATAPPALSAFSQVTVAASGNIHIKSDLKYSTPPCAGSNSVSGTTFTAAPCTNAGDDNKNILGIYSSGGDVDIDSPSKYGAANGVGRNVAIQGVLMASTGRVTVDGYDNGNANDNLGAVNLLGGIIENYYGPFGITDGHGFGRNYVYDPRTGNGLAPPSFPTQQAWSTAFQQTLTAAGDTAPTPLLLQGSQTQQAIQ
jgi:Tfp pilus assembly protein PilX